MNNDEQKKHNANILIYVYGGMLDQFTSCMFFLQPTKYYSRSSLAEREKELGEAFGFLVVVNWHHYLIHFASPLMAGIQFL